MRPEDSNICPDHYYLMRGMGWQHKEIAKSWGVGRSSLYESLGGWPVARPELSKEAQRFIECSLLGDGCVVQCAGKARFQLFGINEIYIQWVRRKLISLGFPLTDTVSWDKTYPSKAGGKVFAAVTRTSSLLVPVRSCWYPKGKKQVLDSFKWGYDALDRIIAEDGGRCSSNVTVVYWGVKSDRSFERFRAFVRTVAVCREGKRQKSSGRLLYIEEYPTEGLPGYEHKYAGVSELA